MSESYSGVADERLLSVEEAHRYYGLEVPSTTDSLFASETHRQLAERGIATIEMPLTESDFKSLLDGYEICIEEFPELLKATYHKVDRRFGNEAGHIRKEAKYNPRLERQTADPKNSIHFNEYARARWMEQFSNAPSEFRAFLDAGNEIHNGLIAVAKRQFELLDETHRGILNSHFPGVNGTTHASMTFMRLISYDGYDINDSQTAEVAKAHYDISGATIQAYADSPGFWGAEGGRYGERQQFDTLEQMAYFFLGRGYEKLYGSNRPLNALYHGVKRIVPSSEETTVPARHAVILFIDSPFIDYDVKPSETLPELYE